MMKKVQPNNDAVKNVIQNALRKALADGNHKIVDQLITKNIKGSTLQLSDFNMEDTSLMDLAFLKWRERIEKFDKSEETLDSIDLSGYEANCRRMMKEGMTSDEFYVYEGAIYFLKSHEIQRKESKILAAKLHKTILDAVFDLKQNNLEKMLTGSQSLNESEFKRDLNYVKLKSDAPEFQKLCSSYIDNLFAYLKQHSNRYNKYKNTKDREEKKLRTISMQMIEDMLLMLSILTTHVPDKLPDNEVIFENKSHQRDYDECFKGLGCKTTTMPLQTKTAETSAVAKQTETEKSEQFNNGEVKNSITMISEPTKIVSKTHEVFKHDHTSIAKEVSIGVRSYIDDLVVKQRKEEERQRIMIEQQRIEREENEKIMKEVQQKEQERKKQEVIVKQNRTPKSSPKGSPISSPKGSPLYSKKYSRRGLIEVVEDSPSPSVEKTEIPIPISLSLFATASASDRSHANQSGQELVDFERYTVNGISVHRTPQKGKENKRFNQLSKTQALALRNWKKPFDDEMISCILKIKFAHKLTVLCGGGYLLHLLYQLPYTDVDIVITYENDEELENVKNMILSIKYKNYKAIDSGIFIGDGYQYHLIAMKSVGQIECDFIFVKKQDLDRHAKPFCNLYGVRFDIFTMQLRDYADSVNSFGNRDLTITAPPQDIANIRLLIFFAKLVYAKTSNWRIDRLDLEMYKKNVSDLKLPDTDYLYKLLAKYLNKSPLGVLIAEELIFILHEFKDSMFKVIGFKKVEQYEHWLKQIEVHTQKGKSITKKILQQFKETVISLDDTFILTADKLTVSERYKSPFIIKKPKDNLDAKTTDHHEKQEITTIENTATNISNNL